MKNCDGLVDTCTGLDWLSGDAQGDNFGETLAVDDSAGLVWVAATGVDDPDLGVKEGSMVFRLVLRVLRMQL